MNDDSNKKPFIKKFKTDRCHYIYDVNSNQIVRVNKTEYDIINDVDENDINDVIDKYKNKYSPFNIRKNLESIWTAKKRYHIFSHRRPQIFFGIRSIADVKNALESNLLQIIIELTERCNLRCRYCVFSGRYKYARIHGSNDMSFDIAKKAVDYFLSRSRGNSNDIAAITFYGGEPLLKIDLIKGIVDYVKKIGEFDNCRFSLTTNGTLLHKEIVDYFIKNKLSILVSLDGPKEIHDRYRVYQNGKGTFDIILQNLLRIKENHRDYFMNNISIAATLAPPYDFIKLIDFFYKKYFFEQINEKVRLIGVDPYETTFFDDFRIDDVKNIHVKLNGLFARYKKALINGNYQKLTMEKELFDKEFHNIEYRIIKPLGDFCFPRGTCFPGRRRLFVNALGKYYMCERVGSNYEIGDINEGFNYERIYDFIKKYEQFFSECKYCWALRLCSKCFNSVRKGEGFDEERKKEYCSVSLKTLERYLIASCEIKEKNAGAFKVLGNIIIR